MESGETPAPRPDLLPSTEVLPHRKDITIVFGQGPIKPVLLPSELSREQLSEWDAFTQDPLHSKEPEFRVVEGAYEKRITDIMSRTDLAEDEKQALVSLERNKLQHNPRLALHRYGRLVAMAAGASLLEGQTGQLILSGGKTIPGWAQETGTHPLPQSIREQWPSEAELMKQLIIQIYGDRFTQKYKRDISELLHTEDRSATSIHNFDWTLRNYDEILRSAEKINVLSTDVHLPRLAAIADLTMDHTAQRTTSDAQGILETRALDRRKQWYHDIVSYTHDVDINPIAQARADKEQNLLRELTDPKVLATWELSGKRVWELHETILRILGKGVGTGWIEKARPIFENHHFHFDTLSPQQLEELKIKNPEEYDALKEDIQALNAQFPIQYILDKGTDTGAVTKKNV